MSNRFELCFRLDGQVIRLPVNPASLPVAHPTSNSKYNVLGLGEIMVPRLPDLRTLHISSLFPGRPYVGFAESSGFRPPEFYIQFFSRAQEQKKTLTYTPVRYYENGEPFMTGDSGFDVLVTSFEFEERGGETGDFYYDLTLTEYRNYDPQKLQLQSGGRMGGGSVGSSNQPVQVAAEKTRGIPDNQLYAGCYVTANGNYYNTSAGDEPHGTASGQRVQVQRILAATKAYPVHIVSESGGALGWIKKEALQVVSDN